MRYAIVLAGVVVAGLLLLVFRPAAGIAQDPQAAFRAAGQRAAPPLATIRYGAAPQQVADLRIPSGKGPFPVAVIIHGGCWSVSAVDHAGIAGLANALGKRGFATWNIEYRVLGDAGGGWPGSFEDVAAATDKLAEVAAGYPLDLTRVTVVGHSSGAHFALWVASRPRLAAPWSAAVVRPISVVAIDGPASPASFIGMDAQACGRPVIVPMMGGTPQERPEQYALASPADHLPLGVHQLLVGGAFAKLMHDYADVARASGDTVDLIEPGGADHFDIVTPGTTNGDAVVDYIAAKALVPARR